MSKSIRNSETRFDDSDAEAYADVRERNAKARFVRGARVSVNRERVYATHSFHHFVKAGA